MNCQDIKALLDAFFDRELDLVRSLEIENHVEACRECSRELQNRQALRSTLQSARLSRQAPDSLRQWALRQVQAEQSPNRTTAGWNLKNWFPAGISVAAFAILLAGFFVIPHSPSENLLMEEVVSAHVRSLMAAHLMDVSSTNQHTVKPWFNGKIDFAPTVRDLSEYSFPLIGGRLDYLDHRPVAALVYKRQQHFINLFIWPAPKADDRTAKALSHQGYNLLRWSKNGMNYWAVSDLNATELLGFIQLFQNQ